MKKKYLITIVKYLCLFTFITSCQNGCEINNIDKAIEIVSNNKVINDTLIKLSHEEDVEFIACYITNARQYRILGFQILQSKFESMPPLKIDRPYVVKNVQGIDILFTETIKDTLQTYNTDDGVTKKLIKRGYLTVTGRTPIIDSKTIKLIFCKENNNIYTILSPNFLWNEEIKARNKNIPFIVEKYYPQCN